MSTANSFKQMLEEDEQLFPVPPEIEESVFGSLQILSIMGQAMELYLPKVFEMFILTLGGTIKELDQVAKDELPEGDTSKDTDDAAPGIGGALSDDEPPI
ncbi:MAG: hypothetical protein H6577_08235 [Lewinellaceae bacterium]|nr:hypothetical protein [Saprospiraceae bacterium]MCB9338104.1 hypothetical protein [Lewinellaceae bacterium]